MLGTKTDSMESLTNRLLTPLHPFSSRRRKESPPDERMRTPLHRSFLRSQTSKATRSNVCDPAGSFDHFSEQRFYFHSWTSQFEWTFLCQVGSYAHPSSIRLTTLPDEVETPSLSQITYTHPRHIPRKNPSSNPTQPDFFLAKHPTSQLLQNDTMSLLQ